MRILGLDIETYEDYFCYCSILFDLEESSFKNIKVLRKTCVTSVPKNPLLPCHHVTAAQMQRICDDIADCDYYITFNGASFDNHILAWLDVATLQRSISTIEICREADQIIKGDPNKLWEARKGAITFARNDWRAKHFDVLICSLLRHSLKQWEMFANLPIQELPYDPHTRLDDRMRNRIREYCFWDVESMINIFLWRSVGDLHTRITLIEKRWPEGFPVYFDLKAPKLSEFLIYKTRKNLPVKTNDPLSLFDLNAFEIPLTVKCIIACLAQAERFIKCKTDHDYKLTEDDERFVQMAEAVNCQVEKRQGKWVMFADWFMTKDGKDDFSKGGIRFGVGGCHYMKKGPHKKVKERDVASLYPTIIEHLQLFKTKEANDTYCSIKADRLKMKHKKGTTEYNKCEDLGLKLMLNSPTGLFRLRQGSGPCIDPAVGVAMCLFGQCVITELACVVMRENPDDLVEVNTDSIFFVGDHDESVDSHAEEMLKKYNTLFEPEFTEQIYARDVNNYAVYDADGNFLKAKGGDGADESYKGNEPAVVRECFNNLLKEKLEIDWTKYKWTDFLVKYHKAASSKFFQVGANTPPNKNFYFIWTTKDCPKAVPISFSRDLVDSKSGFIKARYGVYGFAVEDIEYAKNFIDYTQYERDLYVNLDLWGRGDLVPRLSKLECKALKKKSLSEFFFETC